MDRSPLSFSFDIGTNSIGWCVLNLDKTGNPCGVVACGVRVFPGSVRGRVAKPAVLERKAARSASRRRDRFVRRRKATARALVEIGLLPEKASAYEKVVRAGGDRPCGGISPCDPYVLRARALHDRLEPFEIGRALMHLAKRRGRKSRRMGGTCRTTGLPGPDLAKRRVDGLEVRNRAFRNPRWTTEPDLPLVTREATEREFAEIWTAQSKFYPDILTPARCARLFRIVFHERDVKIPPPGNCRIILHECRAPRVSRVFQRFRLLKELNDLRLAERGGKTRILTLRERNILHELMQHETFVSYGEMKRALQLSPDTSFSREVTGSTGIFGSRSDHSRRLDGYGRYGQTALMALIRHLEKDVISETEALQLAGLDKGDNRQHRKAFDLLPPYPEVLVRHLPGQCADDGHSGIGKQLRLANTTVHVALNQLRRVVNRLITRFGNPENIAIEMARDIRSSAPEKAAINLLAGEKNRRAADFSLRFSELRRRIPDLADNRVNRKKVRLWEQLDQGDAHNRRCVYTGKRIGEKALFSTEVELDHILPYSRTLDSSLDNMIVCLAAANRVKHDRAPSLVGEWEDCQKGISSRVLNLPETKRWRFFQGAFDRFEREEGFSPRQLSDTRYLARLAREYLDCLFDRRSTRSPFRGVRVVPSRVTAKLRRCWRMDNLAGPRSGGYGASSKSRNDHRQHAVDAAIIGVVTPHLFRKIAGATAYRHSGRSGLMPQMPWPEFRTEVLRHMSNVIVSHKADHGTLPVQQAGSSSATAGKLHNATAYGPTCETAGSGLPLVTVRKPFLALARHDVCKIRDLELRNRLSAAIAGSNGRDIKNVLADFRATDAVCRNIRRVRLITAMRVAEIRDGQGRVFKCCKGDSNHRADIWELPDGKWVSEVVTMHAAHQPGWRSSIRARHHNARKVMTLHRNDMIAFSNRDDRNETEVARVVKFTRDGRMCFVRHNEAGNLKARDGDTDDPFRYIVMVASTLKLLEARRIRVDEIGTISDPGPR